MPYGLSLWKRTRLRAPLESRRFSNMAIPASQHGGVPARWRKSAWHRHFRGCDHVAALTPRVRPAARCGQCRGATGVTLRENSADRRRPSLVRCPSALARPRATCACSATDRSCGATAREAASGGVLRISARAAPPRGRVPVSPRRAAPRPRAARAWPSAFGPSVADTIRLAIRPNGGNAASSRAAISCRRRRRGRPAISASITGCSGWWVCKRPAPGRRLAAGAPDDLMQELERAFGRARIAIAEPEIGIDDADERERREMMSLGDKLRADDDVDFSFGDRLEFGAEPLDSAGKIARQHQRARFRE